MQTFHRVEGATIAHATGNLTYDSWTHDTVLALAMSGVRNPLGFAIVRHLSETTVKKEPLEALLNELALELVKRGKYDNAIEVSAKAITFWMNRLCPKCKGTGKANFEQEDCRHCEGTGKISSSSLIKEVSEAVDILDDVLGWMDRQISTRMRGMTYQDNQTDESVVTKHISLASEGRRPLGNGGFMAVPCSSENS